MLAYTRGGMGGAFLSAALITFGLALALLRLGPLFTWQVVANALGAGMLAAGVVRLVITLRPSPWQRGTYLFPGALVMAEDERLTVVPFERLPPPVLVKRSHHHAARVTDVRIGPVVLYDEEKHGHEKHEVFLSRYLRARDAYAAARLAGDVAALREGNPFFDCESSGVWRASATDTSGPRFDDAPLRRAAWALTAVATLVAGVVSARVHHDARAQLEQLEDPLALERLATAHRAALNQRAGAILQRARATDARSFLEALFEAPTSTPARFTIVARAPDRTRANLDQFPEDAFASSWNDAVARQVRDPLQQLVDGYASDAQQPRQLEVVRGEQLSFDTPGVRFELSMTTGPVIFDEKRRPPCPLFGLEGTAFLEARGTQPIAFPAYSNPMTLEEYQAEARGARDAAACVAVQLDHHLVAMRKHVSWRLFGAL